MADNYLERHYEEYEAKKAAWEKAKKLGKYKPKKAAPPHPNNQKSIIENQK
ncbi:MAG: hypothetical protein J6U13_07205 [Salinivirgaceae bacterium]|nr:hypothetical protein [Salinivirgaceae bacterium]MBR5167383.1 hypothetical protein [Salinivirgaceae bacterium]